MRIAKRLLLALTVGLVATCFLLAWGAAQDHNDLISRTQDAQPDFAQPVETSPVVPAAAVPQEPLPQVVVAETDVEEFVVEEFVVEEFVVAEFVAPWVKPAVEAEPESKPIIKRRYSKRPVAEVPAPSELPSGLVAPEDAIRMALRGKRAAFEHCYEQALKKQAAFDGFVVLSVTLSLDGRVTDAHVEEGSRRDGQVGACILGQLRRLRLPPLTEEAELLIPIRLQAKKPTI